MQRVEANPALRAVVDGVEPDQFVQRYLVGKGATAADVRGLHAELTPQGVEQTRQYLVRYLRDAATGSTDDITRFSNGGYRRALRDIGDEKLALFFNRDELQHLRDLGDAAKLMQSQPAGSAVNNSNSAAMAIGRGLDLMERVSGKLPLGLRDTINGTLQGVQQRQVLDPKNALTRLVEQPQQRARPTNALAAAILATPAQAGQDDRRQ